MSVNHPPVIYIDGEAGTTGLEIRRRLHGRAIIKLVSIEPERRKDINERKRLLNECDLAILCLPDDAAREAVSLITNPKVKVIDASTAHRVAEGWTYGFPELTPEQEDQIRNAKRVSNPGCYPTGALALIRPLIDAEILPPDHGITINAVSGYSGGGKDLINLCESPLTKGKGRAAPSCLYGLEQTHKHLPEMRVHGRLEEDPIFLPSYSSAFYRGMLVHVALRLKGLKRRTGNEVNGKTIHEVLINRYAGKKYVKVEPLQTELGPGYVLTPLEQNETNNLQLRVFWNHKKETVILTACLDNLGKGASGAAVQNMEIMLGLDG
ncbi:MAG: N-acetyl-gamma-glutamyl-phosphate reductase [Alphaproteobacteria bacterium]|nr:N-acetyl-gamma-glutamyl-phosphate reductase [Alphaproteobacteria bacterium]